MVKKPGRRRRWLQNSTAHFWDVKDHPDHSAIEGADYFYAVINIGTPEKSFDMILDTGSHLTYIPCKDTCKTCGPNHHHQAFDKSKSSTYEKMDCSDPLCSQNKISCRRNECTFSISYMEGSSVHGTYMKEILTLGPELNKIEIPVAIGCIQTETKLIYSQDADGIMGLGDSPVSILNQFHKQAQLPLSFGICFGSDNEGVMTFGEYYPPDTKFTNLVSRSGRESYFHVKVKQMLIDGTPLNVPSSAYGSSTLVDTGSSDTLIPRQVFQAFKEIMGKKVKGSLTKARDGNLCFRNKALEEMYDSIPELVIVLDNDIRITAPFPNLIYKKQASYICTTVFEHYGKMIIGGNTMMDHFIFLDRENKRLGVSKANCKNLKEGLYASNGVAGESNNEVPAQTEVEEIPGTPELAEDIVDTDGDQDATYEDDAIHEENMPVPESPIKVSIEQIQYSTDAESVVGQTTDEQRQTAEVTPPEETTVAQIVDRTDTDSRKILKVPEAPEIFEQNEVKPISALTGVTPPQVEPDTWLTWEFMAMFIVIVTLCAYAIYNTPQAKHQYTQVSTNEPEEEAFAELAEMNDEVDIVDQMLENELSGNSDLVES